MKQTWAYDSGFIADDKMPDPAGLCTKNEIGETVLEHASPI
jgi:hypothetical protein